MNFRKSIFAIIFALTISSLIGCGGKDKDRLKESVDQLSDSASESGNNTPESAGEEASSTDSPNNTSSNTDSVSANQTIRMSIILRGGAPTTNSATKEQEDVHGRLLECSIDDPLSPSCKVAFSEEDVDLFTWPQHTNPDGSFSNSDRRFTGHCYPTGLSKNDSFTMLVGGHDEVLPLHRSSSGAWEALPLVEARVPHSAYTDTLQGCSFAENNRYALFYSVTQNGLLVYEVDGDQLTLVQSVNISASDASGATLLNDKGRPIQVSPDHIEIIGNDVYVPLRNLIENGDGSTIGGAIAWYKFIDGRLIHPKTNEPADIFGAGQTGGVDHFIKGGPRTIKFNKAADRAYVLNQYSDEIVVLTRNTETGELGAAESQRLSILANTKHEKLRKGGDLLVLDNFVYVTNRPRDINSEGAEIAIFPVNEQGLLSPPTFQSLSFDGSGVGEDALSINGFSMGGTHYVYTVSVNNRPEGGNLQTFMRAEGSAELVHMSSLPLHGNPREIKFMIFGSK